jgi:hypothetical protein
VVLTLLRSSVLIVINDAHSFLKETNQTWSDGHFTPLHRNLHKVRRRLLERPAGVSAGVPLGQVSYMRGRDSTASPKLPSTRIPNLCAAAIQRAVTFQECAAEYPNLEIYDKELFYRLSYVTHMPLFPLFVQGLKDAIPISYKHHINVYSEV